MTASATSDVYFDPYNVEINADPYPVFRRLREEAPLYYNEQHDFYALSRFDDVNKALVDHGTFSSATGRDPRVDQGEHRDSVGRADFRGSARSTTSTASCCPGCSRRARSPCWSRRSGSYCAESLDPVVGADKFDFVTDLGAMMPMKTISALIGIPEDDQEDDPRPRQRPDADRGGQADEGRRGGRWSGATSSRTTSTGVSTIRPTTS